MDSRAKLLGHAVHPVLVVFPLGLLITSVIFDIIYFATDTATFAAASAYMIAAGIIGGALAGLFGLIDWLAIRSGTRARKIGLLHGGGNVFVLLFFAISWLIRLGADDWRPSVLAFILSLAGVAVGGVTGWLGGELVQRHGVGVHDHAGLDASSSLSAR